jgi:hypothetical protein
MKVTDFPLTFRLKGVFGMHGDIRQAAEPSLSWENSVCLADCHDSMLGDSYKFDHVEDGILAAAFILARGYGIPLLWHEFLEDPRIVSGIQFLHKTLGLPFHLMDASTATVLILRRGSTGLAIINKSSEWFETTEFHCDGLANGVWKELGHEFNITVSHGRITWPSEHGSRRGIHVGPRSALFLVHERK